MHADFSLAKPSRLGKGNDVTEITFKYQSKMRFSKVWLVFGSASLGFVIYVWRFTEWMTGAELRNFGLGFITLWLLLTTLSAAANVFRPVLWKSWIHDGVFGWSAPRCRPYVGKVPLEGIKAVRVDTSESRFTLVPFSGELVSVPWQCVQDALCVARGIVAQRPEILIYVDGIKVA